MISFIKHISYIFTDSSKKPASFSSSTKNVGATGGDAETMEGADNWALDWDRPAIAFGSSVSAHYTSATTQKPIAIQPPPPPPSSTLTMAAKKMNTATSNNATIKRGPMKLSGAKKLDGSGKTEGGGTEDFFAELERELGLH